MNLGIAGQVVIRVCFDEAFSLLLSSGAELRVETSTAIKRGDATEEVFDPEAPGDAAVRLVGLLRQVVSIAEYDSHGGLSMTFDNGWSVETHADPDYEAWGLVDSSGGRVVCMPGGEVATWSK